MQCAVQSRPCRDHVPPSARLEIGRRPRFAPPPRAPAPTTNNSAAFSRPHKEQQESLRSSRAPVPSPRPRGRALTMPVGHERINDPNVHPVSVYSLEETPAPRSHRSEQRLRARALTWGPPAESRHHLHPRTRGQAECGQGRSKTMLSVLLVLDLGRAERVGIDRRATRVASRRLVLKCASGPAASFLEA